MRSAVKKGGLSLLDGRAGAIQRLGLSGGRVGRQPRQACHEGKRREWMVGGGRFGALWSGRECRRDMDSGNIIVINLGRNNSTQLHNTRHRTRCGDKGRSGAKLFLVRSKSLCHPRLALVQDERRKKRGEIGQFSVFVFGSFQYFALLELLEGEKSIYVQSARCNCPISALEYAILSVCLSQRGKA